MGVAVSETKRVIDLTMRMAQRSISSEFKGTALGRLWSFINPIATIAVYALIFGVLLRVVDRRRRHRLELYVERHSARHGLPRG